jgi:hypothetical protein
MNAVPRRKLKRWFLALGALLATAGLLAAGVTAQAGDAVVLSWNDLGMHCMNQWFGRIAILPPYNTMEAQVILKGDATTLPRVTATNLTLDYSIPGNTYSVGKTDFWTYAYHIFGVNLPPNIGLTGKGLTGTLDPTGTHFEAVGIPVTPFPDATPTVADPYQQALLIARDPQGVELGRSVPVIPVAVEMNCISSGCHSSEQGILNQHEQVPGFNLNDPPIFCARCHADPALGTPGTGAGYFSFVMHDQHKFIDQQIPGMNGCYKCHPGPQTQCLRDVMNTQHGMVCQDCHGTIAQVANSIETGRIPWQQEPSCRTCHTANYGEPPGQLYRHSTGHGGVYCSGCHGSPHAIYPSREPRDNANNVALQGHAGILSDCRVCHTVTPTSPGPHGVLPTAVAEEQILGGASRLRVSPSTVDHACTIEFAAPRGAAESGRLLVFDAHGRTVKLLHPRAAGDGRMAARWETDGPGGAPVPSGVYFVRWESGDDRAAGKVVVAR